MERFKSLGVIVDKQKCDQEKLSKLLTDLDHLFIEEEVNKEEVVRVIGDYLPNFSHIETGKSLDSKM